MSIATSNPRPDLSEAAALPSRTLGEAFQATWTVDPDAIALRTGDGSLEITWAEYATRVRQIATGLASIGVRPHDTVALLLGNRPEFHLLDTASFHIGAIPFSIYNTSSAEQIAQLLTNAESRVVVTEHQYLDRILTVRGLWPDLAATIVLLDGEAPDLHGTLTMADLVAQGSTVAFDFDAAWRAVEPQDVATLIYTSGTTGPPKGVELTHANLLAECEAMASVLPVRRGGRITSYLPHAHIADRWASHYNSIAYGIQVTCVADARQVSTVLPALRPTIWGAVPRVVEKLKAALEAGIASDPDEQRRAAMQDAIALGIQKVRLEDAGEPVPAELLARHQVAEEQVLSKLRARIGLDQAEWILVGAAPLTRDVQEFLLGIGLPVSELYGMSECSCCLTATLPADAKIGSVGRALPGVELKVAYDGEMLVRGPIVMRGYRSEPEKTAEVLDSDGWVHTGDIATIDDAGYVRIVDRKKDLIINAGGKNMSPANIEAELKCASPLIGQVVVIGDGRPYNVALIVLDPDAAPAAAKRLGLSDIGLSELAANPEVHATIAAGIELANRRLSRIEQIKRFELLGDEWLPGGDELTPTMKLKRRPIAEKYAATINRLYA